jgi:hypothetical protein
MARPLGSNPGSVRGPARPACIRLLGNQRAYREFTGGITDDDLTWTDEALLAMDAAFCKAMCEAHPGLET